MRIAPNMCVMVQLDGHGGVATASESEGSMRSGDALVYCGQPDGQRQLLRLAQLPDSVDGVAQVCISPASNTTCCSCFVNQRCPRVSLCVNQQLQLLSRAIEAHSKLDLGNVGVPKAP